MKIASFTPRHRQRIRAQTGGAHRPARRSVTVNPASAPVTGSDRSARLRRHRVLDVLVAVCGLALSSPVLAVAAVAIRVTSPGPLLFRQERVGRQGRPFTVLKLRTMYVGGDDRAHRELCLRQLEGAEDAGAADGIYKLDRDARITPAGRWLRRFSIDELPQLVNVLRGEMAIVGPRPMLAWEWDVIAERHRRRAAVAPGLTGLWQVSGRNRLSMLQMLDLDVEYVERRNLMLDLWIILRTALVLVRGDGAR